MLNLALRFTSCDSPRTRNLPHPLYICSVKAIELDYPNPIAVNARYLSRNDVRRLAIAAGYSATRSPEWFFLHNESTVKAIAAATRSQSGDHVLHVGAGLGALTLGLLDRDLYVAAVDSEPGLTQLLPSTVVAFAGEGRRRRMAVLFDDAMTLNKTKFSALPSILVVTTCDQKAVDTLLHLLGEFPSIKTALAVVPMNKVHKSLGLALGESPGANGHKLRFFGEVDRVGTIRRTDFWPPPQIDFGLVRVSRHKQSAWPDAPDIRAEVFAMIDLAFHNRRLSMRTAIKSWAGSGEEAARRLLAASIAPSQRPSELTVADFVRLQQRVKTIRRTRRDPSVNACED